ncbi:hypothetical protein [Nonomuraea dietziae]|uniref:hypothetical protein n=1 Tax=Nonomuraea dietziae TaxID=65515 RepID=UPI0033CA9C2C
MDTRQVPVEDHHVVAVKAELDGGGQAVMGNVDRQEYDEVGVLGRVLSRDQVVVRVRSLTQIIEARRWRPAR